MALQKLNFELVPALRFPLREVEIEVEQEQLYTNLKRHFNTVSTGKWSDVVTLPQVPHETRTAIKRFRYNFPLPVNRP